MKIKKYVAPSMPEAMKKIRAELGGDAVILNSKVVQSGGFLGFFTKKNIEVIAAVDPSLQKEHQQMIEQQQYEKKAKVPFEEKQVIKEESIVGQDNGQQQLLEEIAQLKKLMAEIRVNEHPQAVLYPGELKAIHQLLCEQEVSDAIQQELMNKLVEKWYISEEKPSYREALHWLKAFMIEKVSHLTFGKISYAKKYLNVVGPTGVGKTTTIAKIAADAVLKDKKKVAFITTDTYRIAAIDQLKTYARILCVPLEVCYTAEDFKEAVEKFRSYDVVLIDTAGRNFRNEQYVKDLQDMIQFDESMETYLVLSLTAKQKDMEEIYEQFSSVNINKFIFTKVDETANYGAIINMIDKYQIGVAYLTNGQDVPDDILPVNPTIMMNTIFGE